MKIRKNGKVITLSESDLRRIVKKSFNERGEYDPNGGIGQARKHLKNQLVQGEHDILNKVLGSDFDTNDVFEKLQECFKGMPESCNAMNIVQNEECGLMKYLKCIKSKM